MLNYVVLLLTVSRIAYSEEVGSRYCPGGYQHGNQFEIGRYWYECRDGQVIPKGCLSDNGQRVQVQDTFDTAESRMQCVLDADGYLAILYKSCVKDGREHMVGDQYDDGRIWYQCKKEAAAVRSVPIGCVDDNRQVSFDDKIARGEFVYQCKKTAAGKPEMAVAGCHKDGVKYNIGEMYQSSKLWYTCTDAGSKIIGCVHDGLRLRDGDQFHENNVVYQCTVNGDKTGAVADGCISQENGVVDVKKFGCFWTEGDAPYQYEMTCKYDKEKNTAVKERTRCSYKSSEGVFRVEPGCYAKGNGVAVGCVKEYGTGQLSTKIFPGEKVDYSLGLREC